jgi:phosphohistidine swiveling domain-containing protein
MKAPAAALLALLLSNGASALDPRLAAVPDLEPGAFPGLTLSLGPGRPVCARVTFDRRKAAAGGLIFVTDAGEPGDEEAIRLSEAVIARRGGLTSRAAIAARRHGVPAVALGRGAWDASAPSLTLREPAFGPPAAAAGLAVRAATGEREVVLVEDSAACVDASAGRVFALPDAEAEPRLSAASAVRAFDGLRDEPALERWLESAPSEIAAAALMRELAPRALEGGISAADLARADAAARAAAGPEGRDALAAAERRAWSRALRAGRAQLADCAEAAADAPAADVLDRLAKEAKGAADRAAAAGKVFGGGDGGFGALARACASAAAKRRKSVPDVSPALDDAAAAAGAARTESSPLRPEAWKIFVAENGLGDFLAQTLDDASLGLRRKSERIRARVLEGRVGEATDAGRAVLSAAASCPCLVVGEDATVPAESAGAAPAAVREAWAASWGPGPLGARLRAGRGAAYDGSIRFTKAPKSDLSGLLFSRDPASGRRRVLVEAASGSIDALLAGGAAADRYALEPRSGRVLESVPAAADGKALLSADRLKRLARLARALDAWRGGAVEAAFSFDGDKLVVHHARPLEPPRPPQPLNDPFSPRPAPEALNVKPAR